MINNKITKNNNKVVVILQARMSSSRLPGKVLKHIVGQPMLALQIERINYAKLVNELIVATSTDSSDQPIQDWCNEKKVKCFRGDLNNVLDRYFQASKLSTAEHIIRLTADCPLIDSTIIDEVIKLHLEEKNDYTSNAIVPSFPDGLDVEIMTQKTLNNSWELSGKASEKEHVTLHIRNHPKKYKIGSYKQDANLKNKRWTVDHIEDFHLVSNIYNALYSVKLNFSMQDILSLLRKHPEWELLNQHIDRNEGVKKSILNDE